MACGDYHTLVLVEGNRLKSCGGNKNGVLGHCQYDQSDKKKRCKKLHFVEESELFGKIKMISCGNHHNLLLNDQGTVFAWGNNDYNQVLPLKSEEPRSKKPL